jgi:uncharacterized membrane protein
VGCAVRATRALGRAVPSMCMSPREAQLGYLATFVVVVVVGAVAGGVVFVRHETRAGLRPSPVVARRVVRRPRRVAPGDRCLCGGTLGRTGKTSDRWGDLLGCTGCNRSWSMDGRKILRRPRQARGPTD